MMDKQDVIVGGIGLLVLVALVAIFGKQQSGGIAFASAPPASVQAVENANISIAEEQDALIKDRIDQTAMLLKDLADNQTLVTTTQLNTQRDVSLAQLAETANQNIAMIQGQNAVNALNATANVVNATKAPWWDTLFKDLTSAASTILPFLKAKPV